MLDLAKPVPMLDGEISTAYLLETLAANKDRRLVFHYDGHDVQPSYHVTEVKSGSFNALDCGANPESWQETFIQLWDIVEDNRGHMPASKFLAIMRKVSDSVPFASVTASIRCSFTRPIQSMSLAISSAFRSRHAHRVASHATDGWTSNNPVVFR